MAGLNAKKAANGSAGGGNRVEQEVMDSGTYPVRVVQIIDLGVQPQRAFQGEAKPPVHQIQLTYEFVDEFLKDEEGNELEDKPRWLSEDFPLYNLSSERAKSTKRYKALDPEEAHEGDFSMLLGAPANALVTSYKLKNGPNAGKERNKIQDLSAMRPRDAAKTPELVNEAKMFSLEEPDLEVFLSLPDWLQEKIKSNLEYAGSPLQELLEGGKGKGKGKPEKAREEPQEEPEEQEEDDIEEEERPW
tara:strand:- start:25838 stop:26575 length:738 start_codon:yes stop_codon:yes gene_type:complete